MEQKLEIKKKKVEQERKEDSKRSKENLNLVEADEGGHIKVVTVKEDTGKEKKENWLEIARKNLKKLEKEDRTPKIKKIYRRNLNLTPGSSEKKLKRVNDKKVTTLKELWEKEKINSTRKKTQELQLRRKKPDVEKKVKKIVSGIESMLESSDNGACVKGHASLNLNGGSCEKKPNIDVVVNTTKERDVKKEI